jgi:hypothetical protein
MPRAPRGAVGAVLLEFGLPKKIPEISRCKVCFVLSPGRHGWTAGGVDARTMLAVWRPQRALSERVLGTEDPSLSSSGVQTNRSRRCKNLLRSLSGRHGWTVGGGDACGVATARSAVLGTATLACRRRREVEQGMEHGSARWKVRQLRVPAVLLASCAGLDAQGRGWRCGDREGNVLGCGSSTRTRRSSLCGRMQHGGCRMRDGASPLGCLTCQVWTRAGTMLAVWRLRATTSLAARTFLA